jgi:hypothetical protein
MAGVTGAPRPSLVTAAGVGEVWGREQDIDAATISTAKATGPVGRGLECDIGVDHRARRLSRRVLAVAPRPTRGTMGASQEDTTCAQF